MAILDHVEPNDRTQRFNWIGRAGCVFFFKGFVVRWVWASTLGLKHEPQLGPRLALASSCERIHHAITFLPTESLAKRWPLHRCDEALEIHRNGQSG